MRIHFDNVNLRAATGPNTFALRLAKQLYEMGHEVVFERAGADVSLVFIEPSGALLAPKVVQRLDGIWFKPNEFHGPKNVPIKGLYEKADAVVFQSNFDKNFIEHWWGTKANSTIITNGTKVTPITSFTSPELEQLRNAYDRVFVCSANWHPQKRLKANVDMYMHIRKTLAPKSALIIMGANPDVRVADPHVFYTGSVPEDVYMQIYSMADWMIHLAYLDHCPNTVVECLSQETPIIYSEGGGTRDLVKGFGIAVNESGGSEYDLVDYDNPPPIDVTFVTELKTLREKHGVDHHTDITIETCAKKYVDLFTSLL